MNKLNRKIIAISLIAMLMIVVAPVNVMAASSDNLMPTLEDRPASLTISCKYVDKDNTKSIDGVKFCIYRVSDVTEQYGSVTYTLLDSYKSSGIDFEGMTAEQSLEYAKTLAAIQEASGISGESGTTDGSGEVTFSNLKFGIYLVKQIGKSGSAKKYSEYAPFLVLVPGISESHTWIYDSKVSPKPTITKKVSPKDKKTPKTGDETNIKLWKTVLYISLFGLFCSLISIVFERRLYRGEK